jgi:hypothetical protein
MNPPGSSGQHEKKIKVRKYFICGSLFFKATKNPGQLPIIACNLTSFIYKFKTVTQYWVALT